MRPLHLGLEAANVRGVEIPSLLTFCQDIVVSSVQRLSRTSHEKVQPQCFKDLPDRLLDIMLEERYFRSQASACSNKTFQYELFQLFFGSVSRTALCGSASGVFQAFQEDGELSLKKFPELAQLRQAVRPGKFS